MDLINTTPETSSVPELPAARKSTSPLSTTERAGLAPSRSNPLLPLIIVVTLLVATRVFITEVVHAAHSGVRLGHTVKSLTLPARFGDWKAVDHNTPVAGVLPDISVQNTYRLEAPGFSKGNQPEVVLLETYSFDPSNRHVPVHCLANAGWTIATDDQRVIRAGGDSAAIDVVKGELNGRQLQVLYYLYDPTRRLVGGLPHSIKGWEARLQNNALPASKGQIDYDERCLQPNGDFIPEFKALIVMMKRQLLSQVAT